MSEAEAAAGAALAHREPERGRRAGRLRHAAAALVVVAALGFAAADHDRREDARISADRGTLGIKPLPESLCGGALGTADLAAFDLLARAWTFDVVAGREPTPGDSEGFCAIRTIDAVDLTFAVAPAGRGTYPWLLGTDADAVPLGTRPSGPSGPADLTGMAGSRRAWVLVPCPGQPSDALVATAAVTSIGGTWLPPWGADDPDERAALARAAVRVGNAAARKAGCAAPELPDPGPVPYPEGPRGPVALGAAPVCAPAAAGDTGGRRVEVASTSLRPALVEQCRWVADERELRFMAFRGPAARLLPQADPPDEPGVPGVGRVELQVARTSGQCGGEPMVWMTRMARYGLGDTAAPPEGARQAHERFVAAAVASGCTAVPA
ncbi:hypothetical protein [Yinghuangia soli]|uniref:Uncharacterized protein n=1 Tax=Yinghuangia soli TaxID=2908204 RepID=A0AA41U5H0_9ACTN|nr:hypothetical protein [Yinghuangia soli]MCF2529979.1 hypothetical protein [Yinghuangia soli]